MRKIVSKGLNKIGNFIMKNSGLPEKIEKTPIQKEHERQVDLWVANKGDKTCRLNYDLSETSIVFDLGGYEGQWASDIFSKYLCNILIFEPYSNYAQNIIHRFRKNNKIQVFPFGLSNIDKDESLSILDDSSSIFKMGNKIVPIKLLKASEFIEMHLISKIELMKINIEGGEYELLDHLIDSNAISIIENIQVQFHNFIPNADTGSIVIDSQINLSV
jgi:FkbM family methyltransferase